MNARDYALIELDRRRLPGWPAALPPRRQAAPADPRDRALAEQIVNGVIQNALLLRHLIAHYSRRPLDQIDPLVQKILAIALYQMRFLERIPPSAAVDQAVEQTRRFRRRKASGFVNAILRNAQRQPTLPLPSPDQDPTGHAEIVLSHPPELFQRLVAWFGTEQALRLCQHDNRQPPTIVRLFSGASPDQLATIGVEITPHEQPGMYVVHGAKQPLLADWARRGIAQVQDPTAALVADHLDLKPGQVVLDRCAGLGTKTLQIHDRLAGRGRIVAIDPSGPRCEGLRRIIAHRGIDNISVHQTDMIQDVNDQLPRRFDRILIDVPCSNSGVLPRRPEAKYAQTDRALASLAQLQLQILADTAARLAPGGLLVYSTCSLWPQENTGIIDRFLEENDLLSKASERFTPPQADADPRRYRDGGYLAVLHRR